MERSSGLSVRYPLRYVPLAMLPFVLTGHTIFIIYVVARRTGIDLNLAARSLGLGDVSTIFSCIYNIWNIAILVLLIGLLKRRGISLADLGWRGRLTLRAAGYALVSVLIAVILAYSLDLAARYFNLNIFWIGGSSWNLVDKILIAIGAVIIAPIAEETMHRGYILTALLQRLESRFKALLLSSMLFSLIHIALGPGVVIFAFVVAFMLAYLYLKFNSLYPAMLMHSLYNLISISLGL